MPRNPGVHICGACLFFQPRPELTDSAAQARGECRHDTPKNASKDDNDLARWPLVLAGEWCGKFQRSDESFPAKIGS